MASKIVFDARKTVLVTGCSPGGIGYELARAFHKRGLRVFGTARTKGALAALASEGIEPIELDVTSLASIKAAYATVYEQLETSSNYVDSSGATISYAFGLNYLVNNAGRGFCMPAIDSDPDEVQDVFTTNIVSVVNMCKIFSDLLIRAAAPASSAPFGMRTATIANISSVSAFLPYAFGSVYSASKAALHAYSNALRLELKPFGVHVVEVVTGGVISNIVRTPGRLLPQGSLYAGVESSYIQRQVEFQQISEPTQRYAQKVADRLLRMDDLDLIYKKPVDARARSPTLLDKVASFLAIDLLILLLWFIFEHTGLRRFLRSILRFNRRQNQIWEGKEAGLIRVLKFVKADPFIEKHFTHRFGLDILADQVRNKPKPPTEIVS